MFADHITSVRNPRIKAVIALRNRKDRDASGLTLIEGAREIERAVSAGVEVVEVFVCPSLLRSEGETCLKSLTDSAERVEVSETVFEKLAYGSREEGLVAVARQPRLRLQDVKLPEHPLIVVAEGLEKPGNLGAMLRTCDGVGVDLICVCGQGTDVYNPQVVRASLGAVFNMPIVNASAQDIVEFLKHKHVMCVAADPSVKQNYASVTWTGAMALVVGNEQNGLSDVWRQAADELVHIPMNGIGDSLNVSVSTAVILYEALRQRMAS